LTKLGGKGGEKKELKGEGNGGKVPGGKSKIREKKKGVRVP